MKIAIIIFGLACGLFADQYVNGYVNSNGTYVQGYYRSSPNNTTSDNFSTKGNVNPYSGQEGTKNINQSGNYNNSNNNGYNNNYNNNNYNNNKYGY